VYVCVSVCVCVCVWGGGYLTEPGGREETRGTYPNTYLDCVCACTRLLQ